jgi:predicted O-methyltransferase YrrM
MGVTQYLNSRGYYNFEGHSQLCSPKVIDLIKISSNAKNLLEIGFNAGHSAEVFLHHNKNLNMVSFDLGSHDYVKIAKEYIDFAYPGRHTLILGNSTHTVPEFINTEPNKYDVIFIDGGHEYAIARADMDNCLKLAAPGAIIIVDDVILKEEWVEPYSIGPTQVWKETSHSDKIEYIQQRDYQPGMGMAWGRFNE